MIDLKGHCSGRHVHEYSVGRVRVSRTSDLTAAPARIGSERASTPALRCDRLELETVDRGSAARPSLSNVMGSPLTFLRSGCGGTRVTILGHVHGRHRDQYLDDSAPVGQAAQRFRDAGFRELDQVADDLAGQVMIMDLFGR